MLFPQSNPLRQTVGLPDFWDFRPDPEHTANWAEGFDGGRPIAVPASWNDQYHDLRTYLGDGWYQTIFELPWGWSDRQIWLRFGSINYLAEVWLNGVRLGQHEGGHLPFEFVISGHVRPGANRLVVRVNGDMSPERVPPGAVPFDPRDAFRPSDFPPGHYDFFPYCGIHRPVVIYAVPQQAISDITVTTDLDGRVRVAVECAPGGTVRASLSGFGSEVVAGAPASGGGITMLELQIPGARLWSPESPNLYQLTTEIVQGEQVMDRYTLPVGVRTVAVEGDHLLLNGEPVKLLGFGRHEDFAITGRGYMPGVVIKDYDLMSWVGANSFRTTHYPYSEPMMDLADRLGFLVIDETPAVGLFFHEDGLAQRQAAWKQQLGELIARDKNHPSVIMWSLANEPHNFRPESRPCFEEMFALARSLDTTRPVTFVSDARAMDNDFSIDLCDVICMNRYDGWYVDSGQLEQGFAHLSADLDEVYRRYRRPVIISEFGADTIPGMHAEPPEMFTEEYQAAMLEGFIQVMNSKPFVVGQHVWNLCDFKTSQSIQRVGAMNYKGVFTRDRKPKLAAHRLRALWEK